MKQNDRENKMRLLEAGLARLSQEFIASLPGRVEELDALMDRLYQDGEDPRAVVEAISRLVHKLHGQAGSFGFAEVGKIAADVEMAAQNALENGGDLDPEEVETHLVTLLDMIDKNLQAA